MSIEGHLFDPAEFGAKAEPGKPRKRAPEVAVTVEPPWMVLRHLKSAPRAHFFEVDIPPVDGFGRPIAAPETRLASCGAYGIPMRDLQGSGAPACPRCAERHLR